MKQKVVLITIALAGMTLFSGCKKTGSTSGTIKATINGVDFSTNHCIVHSGSHLAVDGGSYRSTPPSAYIMLDIYHYTGVGTYNITDSTVGAAVDSSATVIPIAIYGTVVVTATSPNIVGTFSFTCADSTKVTNGSFNVKAP